MRCRTTITILLVAIVTGGITFLCVRVGTTAPLSPENYIAELTLVVTVIAGVAALFGLGGVYMTYRATDFASKIEDESERVAQSAQKALASIEESASQTEESARKAETFLRRVSDYEHAIVHSANAFQPSGYFLSERIEALADEDFREQCQEHPWLQDLLKKIAYAFVEHAQFGAQVQKLFTGSPDEVVASAMFLRNVSRSLARKLVAERLELEKVRTEPDLEVIAELGRILGSLE